MMLPFAADARQRCHHFYAALNDSRRAWETKTELETGR